MKVLTVSHFFPSATAPLNGVFVAEFVRALSRFAQVEVLAPASHFPVLRPAHGVPLLEEYGGFRIHRPRYLGLPRAMMNQRWHPYYLATRRFVKTSGFRPDVIHCHWLYPDAYAVIKWAKSMGIKVVVTIHGHAVLGLGLNGVHTHLYAAALREVDHIIAVSSELRELMIQYFSVPEEKISVLFNGVDPTGFQLADPMAARRKLHLPLEQKIVLTVARLSLEKRIDLLIDAVAKCVERDFHLYVAGDGPLKLSLQERISAAGLGDRITLLGGILRILARTNPKQIVILSTAPQIRYPDCYGIDMAELGKFIAFQAAIKLLKERNLRTVIDETYHRCKEELKKPLGTQINAVKFIYEPFTEADISAKIAQMVFPANTPWKGDVKVIFQTIKNLHEAISPECGDWYFSGDYPTPGGYMIANESYVRYYEKRPGRAWDSLF